MKKNLWWLVGAYLLSIYIATIAAHCVEGQYSLVARAVLCLVLGVLLFWGEGFEVAFCTLWARRDSAEIDIRDSLKGLDAQRILSERQLIVAATISAITLGTNFDWIIIPGWGRVTSPTASEVFSALFTTFSVLWLAQVTPKRLAVNYPESFWKRSKWLLRPIAVVGKLLNFAGPCDDLVRLLEPAFDSQSNVHGDQCESAQVAPSWPECDCPICKP
jgi:CBS domain containing-hemolysin-like protein